MTQVPQAPPAAPAPGAPGKRPGGLTALAVLNFVFGGLAVIGAIGWMALAAAAQVVVSGTEEIGRQLGGAAAAREVVKAVGPNMALLWVCVLLNFVAAAMLIVSGVGYMKMSRTSGYVMGHVYAIVAIVSNILVMVNSMFGFMAILGLAYPIITIALLNTVFKKCFPAAA